MFSRFIIFLLGCAVMSGAQAQAGVPSTSEMLLQVFGALVLVVSLIVGAAWITKRFNLVNTIQGGDLNVLASLTLGKKEKVVLVNACGKKLLLGVGANGVNFLHDLTENNGYSDSVTQETHDQITADKNRELTGTQNITADGGATCANVEGHISEKSDFASFLKNIIATNSRENKA